MGDWGSLEMEEMAGSEDGERTKFGLQLDFLFIKCMHEPLSHSWLFETPMDCSPPGSYIYGILQERILDWITISFSKGSSQLRDWTQVSCIAGRFFTIWAPTEAHSN